MSHPVRFVTDSTANLPDTFQREHQIRIVPVYVIFGNASYKDYTEMPPAEFYARLAAAKAAWAGSAAAEMPKTSQPSPQDFVDAYQALGREGATDVISIHVTAKSSGTVNSAAIARGMVTSLRVHVVDSGTTSMLIGYMIEQGERALAGGGDVPAALAAIEHVKANSSLYFTVTELEHLEASGRTQGRETVSASEIKIKPVIGVLDGVPKVVSPERTQKAAIDKVIELTRASMQDKTIHGITVVHGNAIDRAEVLKARVAQELGYAGHVHVTDFGPALTVHFGPGLLGLAAWGD